MRDIRERNAKHQLLLEQFLDTIRVDCRPYSTYDSMPHTWYLECLELQSKELGKKVSGLTWLRGSGLYRKAVGTEQLLLTKSCTSCRVVLLKLACSVVRPIPV